MQEINKAKQESSAQSGKKLFEISWNESVRWYALVQAENKEEVRKVWEKGPENFWLNIDSDGKEIAGEPHIEEVVVAKMRKRLPGNKSQGGDCDGS